MSVGVATGGAAPRCANTVEPAIKRALQVMTAKRFFMMRRSVSQASVHRQIRRRVRKDPPYGPESSHSRPEYTLLAGRVLSDTAPSDDAGGRRSTWGWDRFPLASS